MAGLRHKTLLDAWAHRFSRSAGNVIFSVRLDGIQRKPDNRLRSVRQRSGKGLWQPLEKCFLSHKKTQSKALRP